VGGVGAGSLGDEGDEQREDPVEVVEAVVLFVAGDDEEAAEECLDETETWAARSRYQKEIEVCLRYQAMPPTSPAAALRTINRSPTAMWRPSTV
jgi:hypothetical protein